MLLLKLMIYLLFSSQISKQIDRKCLISRSLFNFLVKNMLSVRKLNVRLCVWVCVDFRTYEQMFSIKQFIIFVISQFMLQSIFEILSSPQNETAEISKSKIKNKGNVSGGVIINAKSKNNMNAAPKPTHLAAGVW